ncbi:MAG: hypothetical protein IKJ77_02195 [Firmicutes bacterium]|nr:hypothetical protein [Bacillota bacterium]
MKHLITMTACLLVLMALLSQFVHNQKLLLQLESGSHMVEQFCEHRDVERLKSGLGHIMGCETDEISVEEQQGVFVVTSPVKRILAAPAFWGIDPKENSGRYQWEREAENG